MKDDSAIVMGVHIILKYLSSNLVLHKTSNKLHGGFAGGR